MRREGLRCPVCGRKYGEFLDGVFRFKCRCGTRVEAEINAGMVKRNEALAPIDKWQRIVLA